MFEDHSLSFVDGRLVSKSSAEAAAFGNVFDSWVNASVPSKAIGSTLLAGVLLRQKAMSIILLDATVKYVHLLAGEITAGS